MNSFKIFTQDIIRAGLTNDDGFNKLVREFKENPTDNIHVLLDAVYEWRIGELWEFTLGEIHNMGLIKSFDDKICLFERCMERKWMMGACTLLKFIDATDPMSMDDLAVWIGSDTRPCDADVTVILHRSQNLQGSANSMLTAMVNRQDVYKEALEYLLGKYKPKGVELMSLKSARVMQYVLQDPDMYRNLVQNHSEDLKNIEMYSFHGEACELAVCGMVRYVVWHGEKTFDDELDSGFRANFLSYCTDALKTLKEENNGPIADLHFVLLHGYLIGQSFHLRTTYGLTPQIAIELAQAMLDINTLDGV